MSGKTPEQIFKEWWGENYPRPFGLGNMDGVVKSVFFAGLAAGEPKWQPIETAPKGQRVFLLSELGEIYAGHLGKSPETGYQAWIIAEWGDDGDQLLIEHPTHWAAPPTMEKQK